MRSSLIKYVTIDDTIESAFLRLAEGSTQLKPFNALPRATSVDIERRYATSASDCEGSACSLSCQLASSA
jgi:hypothetical protein